MTDEFIYDQSLSEVKPHWRNANVVVSEKTPLKFPILSFSSYRPSW